MSRFSNRALLNRVLTLLPVAALAGLLLGLDAGCAIPHLHDSMGTYHERVSALQAKKRLSGADKPMAMEGKVSDITNTNYVQSLKANSMGGAEPDKITLLPVQR